MSSDTAKPGTGPDSLGTSEGFRVTRAAAIEDFVATLSRPASQTERRGRRDVTRSGMQEVLAVDPRRPPLPVARIAAFVLIACVVSLVALAFEPAVREQLPGPGQAPAPLSPAPTIPAVASPPDSTLSDLDTLPAPAPPPPVVQRVPEPPRHRPPRNRHPAILPVPSRSVPPPPPGFLFVSSFPWGHLYLDGTWIGDTPQARVPLTPGTHRLSITRPGYRPLERTITAAPGEDVRLPDLALEDST